MTFTADTDHHRATRARPVTPSLRPGLYVTLVGPESAALTVLYRLGTIVDLTDISTHPEPGGITRVTASAPTMATALLPLLLLLAGSQPQW